MSVAVGVSPAKAYAFAANPRNLPTWAPGFVHSIRRSGGRWLAQTTLGEVEFRFASRNRLGVLDHDVMLPSGRFHNPMRVVPNGNGCEILFTALQWPQTGDAQFLEDLQTVRGDLELLRDALEKGAAGSLRPSRRPASPVRRPRPRR